MANTEPEVNPCVTPPPTPVTPKPMSLAGASPSLLAEPALSSLAPVLELVAPEQLQGFDPEIDELERRRYLRDTVQLVGDRAHQMLSATKSSSSVAKFTIDSVERLVEPVQSFTAGKWVEYGEPLISSIDDKIGAVVEAIRCVTVSSGPKMDSDTGGDADDEHESDTDTEQERGQHLQTNADVSRLVYWKRLKRTLMQSRWFKRVDAILTQNVDEVTRRVVLPAESFYSAVAECYINNDTCESFLHDLRSRLGEGWDDRLTQPAKVFFATAQTASAVIGAGRFFGGAFRLGRAKLHTAIDQLMDRWEQVLGATEDAVDRWLPERHLQQDDVPPSLNMVAPLPQQSPSSGAKKVSQSAGLPLQSNSFGSENFTLSDTDDVSSTPLESDASPYPSADDVVEGAESSGGEAVLHNCNIRQKRRRVSDLACKLSRRVRQCIPSVSEVGGGLQETLVELAWFQRVDEILQQNVVVRSLGGLARPAEHFYETASSTFMANKRSVEQFVNALQNRLGAAWDERLKAPASAFYASAIGALGSASASRAESSEDGEGDGKPAETDGDEGNDQEGGMEGRPQTTKLWHGSAPAPVS